MYAVSICALVVNTKGVRLITCVSYRCDELSNAAAGCVH